jgi:hypothetical protein
VSKKLTIITEVATGLGMIPDFELDDLKSNAQPSTLRGVDDETWTMLQQWRSDGSDDGQFEASFEGGRYFLSSQAGLRDRPPFAVEWKGPHVAPEESSFPADLRVDHVYIISCKNLSKVLSNPSPATLFLTALRDHDVAGSDWYESIAPEEYRTLLAAAVLHLGFTGFPETPRDLTPTQRELLKTGMKRAWPPELSNEVSLFNEAVSIGSAEKLRSVLAFKREQERFYWRLLRIYGAPYFILGVQPSGPMRIMVTTPWDLRRKYEFVGLTVEPDRVGQPQVQWKATFVERASGAECVTQGHFEIRWSHGKFCGAPESKVYLDTPHASACGYLPI